MKDSAIRLAAAAAALAVLFATLTPPPAFAATEPPSFPSGSDGPVYIAGSLNDTAFPRGTQLAWDQSGIVLVALPIATEESYDWVSLQLPAPRTGAVRARTFISAPGDERTKDKWKADGVSLDLLGRGAYLPEATPGDLYGSAPLKASGGTYSLGVAYLEDDDRTVSSVYFTTINVDAGTGTWTFATYVTPLQDGEVATTTTLVADPPTGVMGFYTTLKATVTAHGKTVTGNVSFYNGRVKIGTSALASGVATMSVPFWPSFLSARFVPNTVGLDHFLASTSPILRLTGMPPFHYTLPDGPSENALNANTAHGATATYDAATHRVTVTVAADNKGKMVNVFAYSTPTYLDVMTVDATDATITVDVSRLAAGHHKVAIVEDGTGNILGWASFAKPDAADVSTSMTINADVAATLPADGEFSLVNLSGSTVNLTNPTLVDGASIVSGELGTFKVTDLRQVSRPGWMLMADVATFVKGTDTIGNSALGIAPKMIGQAGTGATTPTLGVPEVSGSAGYPWTIASLPTSNFSGVSTYDIDLVFTAPAAKPAGTYTSTLTLTLISQ